MSLSWNEIKGRALQFSEEWKDAISEEADAKSFWDAFFTVFGVNRRRVATFEYKVTRGIRNDGYIDLLWKGVLLVEHKSAGKSLDMAYKQALDYFPGLKNHELPKYICVCNFREFWLRDLDEGTECRFELKDLANNVQYFAFLAGYIKRTFKEQEPINIEAAYRMGKLHDELKNIGYSGHILEVFLVRILFCLFAEDTSIFEKAWFSYYIQNKTNEDGSDLGSQLAFLFQILNTPHSSRPEILDEDLNLFPYVNGGLFEETLPVAVFSSKMRELILQCAGLDWSLISPAIFGSLFQSTLNPDERRNLGAHYTSEKNIMKVIKPLFLDELYEEFNSIKHNKAKLKEFQRKIGSLRFLDPACGCGNFLVIAYRELRILELEILKILQAGSQLALNIDDLSLVSLECFYGIEIEEWPCRIAETAMWLMEHQMNMKTSEALGQYYIRLPLKNSAKIANANALELDWQSLLYQGDTIDVEAKHTNIFVAKEPKIEYKTLNVQTDTYEVIKGAKPLQYSESGFDYILGNPPYIGSKLLSLKQRNLAADLFEGVENGKILDFVACWYLLAAKYIKGTKTKACFVSTNSITQGEQAGVLWKELLYSYGIKIHFAHRTFRWNNEGKGIAAVHVVIIGFGGYNVESKKLYDYIDIKGEPIAKSVKNISPYLLDSEDFIIPRRKKPICNAPEMKFGNMPLDGGNLLFTDEEKIIFCQKEPLSEKYFLPLISAQEFLNRKKRWCLWLEGAEPVELRKLPLVLDRIRKVKEFRLKSVAPSTQKHAITPTLFRDRNRPEFYILIPSATSETRNYIPIGFFDYGSIPNNSCHIIPYGDLYIFGVLNSEMHMFWVKYTCGRLKSDYRYSKDIVYNNFPWPAEPSVKQKEKLKELSMAILDVREKFHGSSLADLYNPLTMPPELIKAHKTLDKEVDRLYRSEPFKTEAERMEFLFGLYRKYTVGII